MLGRPDHPSLPVLPPNGDISCLGYLLRVAGCHWQAVAPTPPVGKRQRTKLGESPRDPYRRDSCSLADNSAYRCNPGADRNQSVKQLRMDGGQARPLKQHLERCQWLVGVAEEAKYQRVTHPVAVQQFPGRHKLEAQAAVTAKAYSSRTNRGRCFGVVATAVTRRCGRAT